MSITDEDVLRITHKIRQDLIDEPIESRNEAINRVLSSPSMMKTILDYLNNL